MRCTTPLMLQQKFEFGIQVLYAYNKDSEMNKPVQLLPDLCSHMNTTFDLLWDQFDPMSKE